MFNQPQFRRSNRSLHPWGVDPMRGHAPSVDEAQVMPQTLITTPHDQLAEMLTAATSRFARRIRTIAWPDPEMAPARSSTVMRMRDRINSSDYQIDPQLVANAIVDRVCVGDLTTTLH
jgi:hypothetical protein